MTKNKKIKYPWVFWVRFKKRKWYKKFWYGRGANYFEIQFFNILLSIGMPWHQNVLKSSQDNHLYGFSTLEKTNKSFTKWYCLHIGSYK